MKLLSVFVLVFSVFAFSSCQNSKTGDKASDLTAQLNSLQTRLMNSKQELNMEKADSIVYLYKKYAITYPNDSLSVEYLFRAAEVQMGMDKNKECIKTLEFIQKAYPDSKVMPMLLQFKAFIYDDKFQEYDKARECMDELIENYPESELIPNAKAYRDMIGVDPEQMFSKMDSTRLDN